jgi:hypothetical protein
MFYICFDQHSVAPIQGTLTAIRDWFRDYKIPDGKPANRFGLGNKPTSKVSLILASSVILKRSRYSCILNFWWYPSLPQLGICPEGHWRNQWIMGETGEEEDSCWRALTSLRLRSHEKPTPSFSMLFLCYMCIASSSAETFLADICGTANNLVQWIRSSEHVCFRRKPSRMVFVPGKLEKWAGITDFFTNITLCRTYMLKITPFEFYCQIWPDGRWKRCHVYHPATAGGGRNIPP